MKTDRIVRVGKVGFNVLGRYILDTLMYTAGIFVLMLLGHLLFGYMGLTAYPDPLNTLVGAFMISFLYTHIWDKLKLHYVDFKVAEDLKAKGKL